MEKRENAGSKFRKLVQILDTLRGEEGCPWDREQDEKSITNYFLEEVYEAVDAIFTGNAVSLAEELGDVLMEVVFLSKIYEEKEMFSVSDVLEGIIQKMIRRHPHVFARKSIETSKKVFNKWQRQKKAEKDRLSLFDGMAKCFPSLLEAFQIGHRVSPYGFDWEQPLDALQKVKEELCELENAIGTGKEDEILHEIGDIFFSLANVSRHLGINPEVALKHANKKFIRRFQFIEKRLKERGKELENASLEEMDEIWEEAKDRVK